MLRCGSRRRRLSQLQLVRVRLVAPPRPQVDELRQNDQFYVLLVEYKFDAGSLKGDGDNGYKHGNDLKEGVTAFVEVEVPPPSAFVDEPTNPHQGRVSRKIDSSRPCTAGRARPFRPPLAATKREDPSTSRSSNKQISSTKKHNTQSLVLLSALDHLQSWLTEHWIFAHRSHAVTLSPLSPHFTPLSSRGLYHKHANS